MKLVKNKTDKMLERKRKELGISLYEIANRSGIAYGTIWAIFKTKRQPKVETCKRIAKAMGISTYDFWKNGEKLMS